MKGEGLKDKGKDGSVGFIWMWIYTVFKDYEIGFFRVSKDELD